MFEISSLYIFIFASFLLCLSPGPDNIYVLSQGLSKGKKDAIFTSLGLASGLIIHTISVIIGLASLIKSSTFAFDIIRYLGALYLLYLAYKSFINRKVNINIKTLKDTSINLKKLYLRGFIMNILNPKVSIFFLAFLPSFVNTQGGNIPLQILILGLIFMLLTILVFSSIGIFASILRQKILKKDNILKYLNISTSLVLLVLSIKLAFF